MVSDMKWAALFNDVTRFVIFEGGASTYYPDWFVEFIEDNTYEDEYRYTMLYPRDVRPGVVREHYHRIAGPKIWPDELIEGEDVFLLNNMDDVYRISLEDFDKYYNEVAYGVAALKVDCIEYVHYVSDYDMFPDWFVKEVVRDGEISVSDGLIYADIEGQEILFNTGQAVFLRNKYGEIKVVDSEEFSQTYVWWRNWRLSEYDLI